MQVCDNSVIRFADRFKGASSICMVCNYVAGASGQLRCCMYTMLTC